MLDIVMHDPLLVAYLKFVDWFLPWAGALDFLTYLGLAYWAWRRMRN